MSDPLPFTHVVLALQGPRLGKRWAWTSFWIVLAFIGGASIISARYFRWV